MVRRDILTRVLRIVIGIGLAYALIHFTLRSTGGDVWNEISHAQYFFLLIALLFHGAIIGIAICRWNLLLRVQQMRLSAWDLVRLTTTGVFFNLAIPGAVGGDLVKMT
ncbi:MAG: hypothetical protein GTO24_27055, partial [candidate division Zixibacteria bacterium]|nr:hypothetical protein [candidate division Zixibacteria bacterium]